MEKPSNEELDKALRIVVADLSRKGWKQLVITLKPNGDEDFHLHYLQTPMSVVGKLT